MGAAGTWKGCPWAGSSDWWLAGAESWSASASGKGHSRKGLRTTGKWAPKQAQEEPPKESTVACSSHEDPTEDPTEDQDASAKVAINESRHQALVPERLHAGE